MMNTMTRRFLSATLLVSSLLTLTPTARAERDPIRLTHGPMLGKPTSDSMSVWGRTSDPGEFVVHYGVDPKRMDHSLS